MYYHDESKRQRTTVITRYNTKAYTVDELIWSKNPKTHVFLMTDSNKQKSEINMIDYFKKQYNIDLERNADQPLLLVHNKRGDIYLPVSECNLASLP